MSRLQKAMSTAPPLDPDRVTAPPDPRRILLINPFYAKDPVSSFSKHVLTPSLALTSIAGATPRGWDLSYWDENLLQGRPPTAPFPAVVGITVHLTFAHRAYELADWYRARGAKVILGGLHVQSCPDEAAPHADALVLGDGVPVWPLLLTDVESGCLASRYDAGFTTPYRVSPRPRRDLLGRSDFLTGLSLMASRGCHNRCGFCYLATSAMHMPYQLRDVDDVVAEFRDSGEPYGVFIDNNLGSKPEFLRALARGLASLDVIWSAAITIDVTDDPSLVRDLALSGCTAVFIGFESLTGANLDDARKKSPHPDDYARRVALLHDHGIAVNGSFVLGFDHDRPEVFDRTSDWVEANRLECATFHILTPYPGTPLFHRLEAEGRILHHDWRLYDTGHVVFQPRHMSPETLEAGYRRIYRQLFSTASIWRRRPARASDVIPFFGMSLIYKRANRIWPFLIRHRLTGTVWRPLVRASRARHLHFRRRLAALAMDQRLPHGAAVYGGV